MARSWDDDDDPWAGSRGGFANPDLPVSRRDVFGYASVGLVRLIAIPAAQRLIELGQPSTRPEFRKALVQILTFRDTPETREVLKSMAP
jgi:hypothetical protein